MKIIDFIHRGQSVRFILGEDDLDDWCGDDWDDRPYEHNAGQVYDEYVSGHIDVVFDFDDLVLEPSQDWHNCGNSQWCKNDMKERLVPCIVVVPQKLAAESFNDEFNHWVGADGVTKFYFGDSMEPTKIDTD